MSEPIKVTVDGPPLSADITLVQVREYMRSMGWESRRVAHGDVWGLPLSHGAYYDILIRQPLGSAAAHRIVCGLASAENRQPSDVLADIARVGVEHATGADGLNRKTTERHGAAVEELEALGIDHHV